MKLLVESPYVRGSRDYLFARVRCRRAELSEIGLLQRSGSGNPRQALAEEYRWLYRQLEDGLMRDLLPLFEYFELRQLVVALRYLGAGERAAMDAQLRQCLLQLTICRVLQTADQVVAAVKRLESLLEETYPLFKGSAEVYLKQGPGGLEQTLVGGYLQQAVKRSRAKPVRRFLLYLLDTRNLQALYKHFHWQLSSSPPLLTGGTLKRATLQKIWRQKEPAALSVLLERMTRQSSFSGPQDLEDALDRESTRRLRLAGRDPLQVGVVIDYLWRCQQRMQQQGLRLFVSPEDAAAPGAEVTG